MRHIIRGLLISLAMVCFGGAMAVSQHATSHELKAKTHGATPKADRLMRLREQQGKEGISQHARDALQGEKPEIHHGPDPCDDRLSREAAEYCSNIFQSNARQRPSSEHLVIIHSPPPRLPAAVCRAVSDSGSMRKPDIRAPRIKIGLADSPKIGETWLSHG
jgi:hypothetical protein